MGLFGSQKGNAKLQQGFSLLELLVVMFIMGILAAIAIPQFLAMERNQRIRGDAHSIAGDIAIAKMRAGADFTEARVYLDLGANKHWVDEWDRTNLCWHPEGTVDGTCSTVAGPSAVALSQGVTAGFGGVGTPPPNTTAGISQASACTDNTRVATIVNTACIVFNSRGMPLNSTAGGLYVTDTNSVYGVTVNASGMVQTWGSSATGANWTLR
jgi:prepilin-type N-terminal cleavage/methylation domain-containing protein